MGNRVLSNNSVHSNTDIMDEETIPLEDDRSHIVSYIDQKLPNDGENLDCVSSGELGNPIPAMPKVNQNLEDNWDEIFERQDNTWEFALCAAVHNGDVERLMYWYEKNPSILDILDSSGNNIMHYVAHIGQTHVMNFLASKINVNSPGYSGQNALLLSAREGYTECMKILLQNGADVNAMDKNKCVALTNASRNGNIDCVKILLDSGANAGIPDKRGWLPLHFAAECGHYDCIATLLDSEVDINAQSNLGATPLYLAVQAGHHECVQILLAHGADVNKQNEKGQTPLLKAIKLENMKIVISLLNAKADINVCDNTGQSPLKLASRKNLDVITHLANDVVIGERGVTTDDFYKRVGKALRMDVPGALRCLIGREANEKKNANRNKNELNPDYLKRRLDQCIKKENETIRVDYSSLVFQDDKKSEKLLLIFLGISKEKKLEHLILHPTIRIFLRWKWMQFAKYFYINLAYFILTCLNILIFKLYFYSSNESMNAFGYISYGTMVISFICLVMRELIQVNINCQMYIGNIENMFEVAIIAYIAILLVWYPEDINNRVQVSAIGNILIAVSLTLLIGHHPKAASAVHLLRIVTYKFLSYFIIYITILVAFSYSFYELTSINTNSNYNSLPQNNSSDLNTTVTDPDKNKFLSSFTFSFLRTIGMFIGELNLSDLLSSQYNVVMIVVLLIFTIFVSIIILNLLNALAVSNILEKDELKLSYHKSQLEYICNLNQSINYITYGKNHYKNLINLPRILIIIKKKCINFIKNINSMNLRLVSDGLKKSVKKCGSLFAPVDENIDNIFIIPNYFSPQYLNDSTIRDKAYVYSNTIHKYANECLTPTDNIIHTVLKKLESFNKKMERLNEKNEKLTSLIKKVRRDLRKRKRNKPQCKKSMGQ